MKKEKNKDIRNPDDFINELSKHENNLKPIQTMLKSMYNSTHPDLTQKQGHNYIVQKRTPITHIDPIIVTEKTTKIKKNKKNKKKPTQSSQEKIYKHELCECCRTKTRKDVCVDDDFDGSDEDEFDEDDSITIAKLAACIMTELLQEYYDDFDKNLGKWLRKAEEKPVQTFMNLMIRVAEKFEEFDIELREEIDREFDAFEDPILMQTKEEAPAEFKSYMISRFPLLKDFIQNFDLKMLTDDQSEELEKISSQSQLIDLILTHMRDIANKKRKKKNKKKKQQEKKNVSMEKPKQVDYQVLDYQTGLINWITTLKIDKKFRQKCTANEIWVQQLKHSLTTSENSAHSK